MYHKYLFSQIIDFDNHECYTLINQCYGDVKMKYNKTDLYEQVNDVSTTFIWKTHENLGYYPHFHAAVEVYFLLDGTMEAEINGKSFKMEAGDISIANPFEIHMYSQTDVAHVSVLIFSNEFLNDFNGLYQEKILPTHLTDKEYNKKILEIMNEVPYSFTDTTLSVLARKAYVNLILDKIISHYGITKPNVTHNQIMEIISYIYKNYNKPITLETLSKEFNYTRTSISRLLSKYLKTDLRCFLNNLRAEQAKNFLANPKYAHCSILEIASFCGFESAATFYRSYKRRYNSCPRKS